MQKKENILLNICANIEQNVDTIQAEFTDTKNTIRCSKTLNSSLFYAWHSSFTFTPL